MLVETDGRDGVVHVLRRVTVQVVAVHADYGGNVRVDYVRLDRRYVGPAEQVLQLLLVHLTPVCRMEHTIIHLKQCTTKTVFFPTSIWKKILNLK